LILGAGALGGALAASLVPLPRSARAEEGSDRHGISAFGDLKYPPDFRNFDYVDPNAPKGGTVLADRPEHHLQSKLPHV
jgi:ABC-type oligopeptide transport system, periplasmic component